MSVTLSAVDVSVMLFTVEVSCLSRYLLLRYHVCHVIYY